MAVTAIVTNRGSQQFQGLFTDVWTVTYKESANIAPTTGIDAVSTVAVPGVALGDIVLGVSCSVDSNSMTITGNVSSAGNVKICWANNTGSTITLTTPQVYFVVARPNFKL
jgi:hypothetical protein